MGWLVARVGTAVLGLNVAGVALLGVCIYRDHRYWVRQRDEGWTRIDDIEAHYAHDQWRIAEYRRRYRELGDGGP